MNAKLHTYSAKKFNNLLSSISRLLYYILHATAAINYFLCNTFFFHMITFPTYIYLQSMPSIDPLRPIVHTLCFSWSASAMASKASCPRAVTSQHLQPGSSVPKGSIPAKYLQDPPGSNALTSSWHLSVRLSASWLCVFNSSDCMGSFISHTRCQRTRSSASWCNSRNCTPEMISLSQQRQEKAWDPTAGQVGNLSSTSEPFAGKTHRRFPPSSLLSTIPAPGRFPAAFQGPSGQPMLKNCQVSIHKIAFIHQLNRSWTPTIHDVTLSALHSYRGRPFSCFPNRTKNRPSHRLLVVGQVRFQSSQRTTNHHLFPPGSWRKGTYQWFRLWENPKYETWITRM